MKVYINIYNGFICRKLECQFVYTYIDDPESKYRTYRSGKNWGAIYLSYALSINTGSGEKGFFVTDRQYGAFKALLKNSIKLISENLFELFPNVGSPDFEMSERVLERFKAEKAQSSMNITILPALYVSPSQETFPGMELDDGRGARIVIPLEDAVAMYETLKTLDVVNLSLSALNELRS